MGCSSSDDEFLNEYKARFSTINVNKKGVSKEKSGVDFPPEAIDKDLALFASDSPDYYNTPDLAAFTASYHSPSPSRNKGKKEPPNK
jgi:hypothetical protein